VLLCLYKKRKEESVTVDILATDCKHGKHHLSRSLLIHLWELPVLLYFYEIQSIQLWNDILPFFGRCCISDMADVSESETGHGRCGRRCVAMGCSNTNNEGVSLHQFPFDRPNINRQWVAFVTTKRKDWKGPTKHSVLCAAHFRPESFSLKSRILQSMGNPSRKVLEKDAIPTLQSTTNRHFTDEQPPAKKPRTAFIKRENHRVST